MIKYPHEPGFQDRDTSRQAAFDFKKPALSIREQVFNCLRWSGMTVHEVATFLDRTVPSVQPRFSELVAQGKIIDTGERRLNNSGKKAIVWRAR